MYELAISISKHEGLYTAPKIDYADRASLSLKSKALQKHAKGEANNI